MRGGSIVNQPALAQELQPGLHDSRQRRAQTRRRGDDLLALHDSLAGENIQRGLSNRERLCTIGPEDDDYRAKVAHAEACGASCINAVCYYENPYPAVRPIKYHLAFQFNQIDYD